MPDFGFISMTAAKNNFFDRPAVMNAANASWRAMASRMAAYVRGVAKKSMRRRRKASPAGKPPSVHAGQLRNLIYFAYDPESKTAVIGPVRFKDGTAPNLLEFGGTVTRKRHKGRGSVTLTYHGNPFMRPAGEEAANKPAAFWQTSIKR